MSSGTFDHGLACFVHRTTLLSKHSTSVSRARGWAQTEHVSAEETCQLTMGEVEKVITDRSRLFMRGFYHSPIDRVKTPQNRWMNTSARIQT